jgi:hypothetical protein
MIKFTSILIVAVLLSTTAYIVLKIISSDYDSDKEN